MAAFEEFARGRDLAHHSESPLGTLHAYSQDGAPCAVRRFDREWPASLLTTYLDMLEAAQQWIDKQPGLAPLLRVERPFIIGDDFYVMRRYPHYGSTTHIAKLDPDDDPEVEQYQR